ncbi:hypothetical protein ACXDJA_002557 [Klebsiella variicola]
MRAVDKVLFLYLIIVVLAIGGWIANIVKIITTGFVISQWGGLDVARCIGVFIAPLGSILGFF